MTRAPGRLAALALALVLGGCPEEPAPTASRVNAARRTRPVSDGFCDVAPAAGTVRFALPPLASPAPAAATGGGWRWVNVWATWCKPCVAELPLLQKWPGRLGAQLVMLSVDESDAALQAFRQRHPGLPLGPRLSEPAALGPWLTGLGLSADSSIPVHVFVDPKGSVRCVRAGTLTSSDYPRVASVLTR